VITAIVKTIIRSIAILIAAYLVPGVVVDSFFTALVVAIVLSLLNLLVKPILILLTLPLTIISLGLFTIVINTVIILLADYAVSGFAVTGFLSALIFSLVLSLVSMVLFKFGESR